MRLTAAKAVQACEILNLDFEGVNTAAVAAAYRNATKACHPDSGNHDPAKWEAITWAKETLEAWIKAVARAHETPNGPGKGNCRACAGQGYTQRRQGFALGPRMRCVLCEGSGHIKPHHDRET